MLNTRPLTYTAPDFDRSNIFRPPTDIIQNGMHLQFPNVQAEEKRQDPCFVPTLELATLHTNRQAVAALKHRAGTQKCSGRCEGQYPTSLREKHTLLVNARKSWAQPPREGAVVLIIEAIIPRHCWKAGVIEVLISNANGTVRRVLVCIPPRRMITSPINLIIPLELEDEPSTSSLHPRKEDCRLQTSDASNEVPISTRWNLREQRKFN